MTEKQVFMKNYEADGGIYNPERYYEYHKACEQAEKDLSNATYSPSANRCLVKEAKEQAFNRYLRY